MKTDKVNFLAGFVENIAGSFGSLKLAFSIVAVGCFGQIGTAQMPATTPLPPERPRELVRLLGDARLAAPEISVDTFLKVAKSKKITEPVWRRQILEEAFRAADEVKYPVRRKVFPVKGIPVDTNSGYLSYAYDLKLDALSLKSRLIRQLVEGDKERAKQIVFEMGGQLGLSPLECKDTLVYYPADIYGAVAAVAKAVFTKKEIAEGIRALYVAPWFENINSPSQAGPAFDLLAELRGSPVEKQLLFNALAKAINRNFNDDRSFSYAIERDQLAAKVGRLVSGTGDEHLKADLVLGFKGFLLKNLNTTRCKDSEFVEKEKVPDYIGYANYLFPEKPLTFEDILYSDLKGNAEVALYWRSANAVRLQREFRALRAEKEKDPKSTDRMSDVEWGAKVGTFLENIDGWKSSDKETESDVFNQKCVLFRTLVLLVPDGPMKKSVFRHYMRFLGNSPIQKQSFIEWMYHAERLASSNPTLFKELGSDSPNAHFGLMIEAKRLGF